MRFLRDVLNGLALWLLRFRDMTFGKRLAVLFVYLIVTWFVVLGLIPATLGYSRLDPYDFIHAIAPFRAIYGGNALLAWMALFFRAKAKHDSRKPKRNIIQWFFGSYPTRRPPLE